MDKHCPFWADSRQCGTSQCGIAFCDDEVPEGLRRPRQLNNAVDAVVNRLKNTTAIRGKGLKNETKTVVAGQAKRGNREKKETKKQADYHEVEGR